MKRNGLIIDVQVNSGRRGGASASLHPQRQRGVALVAALIITAVVLLMTMSVIYLVLNSTTISGAGKRYATASEAADGAVEAMKELIRLALNNETESKLTTTFQIAVSQGDLLNAIFKDGPANAVKLSMSLPSTGFTGFDASIILELLYRRDLPGGRIEFARSAGGAQSTSAFYRISTKIVGPDNATAETTALYQATK